jgi:hypothetical protein
LYANGGHRQAERSEPLTKSRVSGEPGYPPSCQSVRRSDSSARSSAASKPTHCERLDAPGLVPGHVFGDVRGHVCWKGKVPAKVISGESLWPGRPARRMRRRARPGSEDEAARLAGCGVRRRRIGSKEGPRTRGASKEGARDIASSSSLHERSHRARSTTVTHIFVASAVALRDHDRRGK